MGFKSLIKGNRALALQRKGQKEEAIHLYDEAIADGLNDPRYLLPYALLLIRDGQYQKAKDFLVAHQRMPGVTPQQRTELLVYYATCCMRLGNVDKGISALEQQALKGETGLLYQTLGYLYIEKYDLVDDGSFKTIRITLKYDENRTSVISGLRRISKPGLRIYSSCEEMPKVRKGLGIVIVSTSKGIMTDKKARELNVGG